MIKKLSIICILSFFANICESQIRITEICASNIALVADPLYHEYSDWLEITNTGNSSINLQHYYLTDNKINLKKHRFNDPLIIKPGEIIILWADEKDTINHIDFELPREGATLIISDSNLQIIDSITYPYLVADISYG